MIKVETIYAPTDDILEEKLNEINGRIIKIGDCDANNNYEVIYEQKCRI